MREQAEDAGSAGVGVGVRQEFEISAATGPPDGIARARATQYLLLANLLARAPSPGLLGDLAAIQGDASPLGMAQLTLAHGARAADPGAIAREYLDLFIGVGRGLILPYASFYLTGFLHQRPLARVREDMARLGLERQVGVFEPEDHIASLFEIMAGLVGGSFAMPSGEASSDPSPASAADRFFMTHVEPWAPRLMADIAAAPASHFYRHVARLGMVWLEIEQEAVRLPE